MTITASAQSGTYGTALGLGTTSFTTAGLVGSDAISGVTLQYSGSSTVPSTTAVGTYAIVPSSPVFSSGSASNYTITYTSGTLTIGKAVLTITAGAQSVPYGTAAATVTGAGSYTPTGFKNTDNSSVISGTVTYTTTYTATTAAGTAGVTITPGITGLSATNYSFSAATGSITVTAATPVVTVTNASPYTYTGGANGPTAATNTGTGTTYTWSYVGTGTTTYGPSTTRPTNVGTYTATATVAANGNYGSASSTATSFTIAAKGLTITASAQSGTYGTALGLGTTSFTTVGLVGTDAISGVTLQYSGSSTVPSTTAAGTYATSIVPSSPVFSSGSASNYTITYTSGTLTIGKKALTITASAQSCTYGTAYPLGTTSFTTSSLVGTDAVSGVTLKYGGATTVPATTAVGVHAASIVPSAAVFSSGSSANYTITYTSGTLTVIGLAPVVTVHVSTYTYSGAAQGPTGNSTTNGATNTGTGTTYTWSYVGTTGTTYGPTATRPTNAGTYTATATVAANGNYAAASSSATAFTIGKATPTITVTVGTYTYSGAAQGPTAVTGNTGGGTLTWSYVGTGSTTYGPSSTRPTNAGTYTATASVAATTNYLAATSSATAFTIGGKALTITASAQTGTYGTALGLGTTSFTKTGLVGTDAISGVTLQYSGSSTVPSTTAAGTYATSIVPSAPIFSSGSASNYTITYTSGTLTIGKKALTITASAQSCTYGTAYPLGTTSFTTSSLVGTDAVSGVTLKYGGATTVPATTAVGVHAASIVPSAAVFSSGSSANYTITYTSGTLTVIGLTPTVTVTVGAYTYSGAANGPNTATNTGTGTAYTWSYVGTSGTTYGPTATRPTNVGTYTATATVAANGNYVSASSSATMFTIAAKALTITASAQSGTYGTALSLGTTSFTKVGLVGTDAISGVTLQYSGSATVPSTTAVGTYAASIVPSAPVFSSGSASNYTITYTSGTLTIAKATPTITTQPTATNIVKGQSLASSTLSGGVASVTGGFAFTTPATIPGGGTTTGTFAESYTFTPSVPSNYNSVVGSVNVTVTTGLTVPTVSFTVGTYTYNGSAQGPTVATNTGNGSTYTWSYVGIGSTYYAASSTPPTNAGTYNATATVAATSSYASGATTQAFTINQATTTITTAPTATGITFGQTLASSTLSGGVASVGGSFAFTTPSTSPNAGTANQSYTFTPTSTNYTTVTGNVSVTVSPATLTVTASDQSKTYGTTSPISGTLNTNFTVVGLQGTDVASGATLSYSGSPAGNLATATAGNYTITPSALTLSSGSTGNYSITYTTGTLTIGQVTTTITTLPTASTITYGQTLSNSTLSGGVASVPGTFAFYQPSGIPDAGTASQTIVFTPTDAVDYSTVTSAVNVTVTQATPTVTVVVGTYPYSGSSQGPTTATNTGTGTTYTWSYVGTGSTSYAASSTPPTNAGTYTATATVAASSDGDYTVATSAATAFTIDQLTPTITTNPTASDIYAGQTLASSTLSGGVASVAGTFSFTTPSTVISAGTATVSVTFTPTDAVNYTSVTTSVNVNAYLQSSSVTVTGSSTFTYNSSSQGPSSSTVTGSSGVVTYAYYGTGTTAYDISSTPPTDAGTYEVVATVAADSYYDVASSAPFAFTITPVTLTVTANAQTVTFGTDPSDVTAGETYTITGYVGGDDASFISGVPSFTTTYTNTDDAGTTGLTITPDVSGMSSIDYTFSVVSGAITVVADTPTVTVTVDSYNYLGIPQGPTTATNTGTGTTYTWIYAGTGSTTYTASSTLPTNAGTYTATATVAASTDGDFVSASSVATPFTIGQAIPTITTIPTASDIYAGQALSSSTLSGGAASVAGTFDFTTPSTIMSAGTTSVSVTFTPTDAVNYATVTTSTSINVLLQSSTITVTGASSFTYNGSPQGPTTSSVTGSAGAVTYAYSGTGSTVYATSATLPTNVGTYSVVASVAADALYNSATSAPFAFTISPATPTITVTVGTYTYNGTPQGPTTVTGNTGGGTVTWSYVGTGSTVYSTSSVLPTNAGTYTATASVAASGNYYAATSTATAFTILAATPTIIVTVGTYTYNGTPQGPTTVTGNTGGGTVTWSYVGTGTTSYGPSSTPPTNAGTYTATASVAASGNYGAATSSATAFTIGKAVLTITANALSVPYSTAITYVTGSASYTPTGFVNGETASVISGSVSYTTNYTSTTPAGSTGIIITPDVTSLSASNYSFTAVAGNITVTGTGGIWTGATNTDFGTGSNWSDGNVPSGSDDITIPSTPSNQPVLGANETVNSLNLVGTLSLNGHSFTVGTISGTGYIKGSTSSSLSVGGGTLYFDPSYNTLNNLTITGSTSLANALNIVGVLTPTSGIFTTSGNLTLKSSSETQTAVVGVVGGTVSGNITVERFVAQGLRTFRDLCPEVAGAGSVFTNWQEGGVKTNGYGVFISGVSGYKDSVDASTGFDVSVTGAGSMQTYSSAGWAYPASTKGLALNPYRGYRLLIRGNRSGSLFTTPQPTAMWSDVILRATGSLVTGSVTFNTSGTANGSSDSSYGLSSGANAFSFLGNPYVCPINWNTVTSSHLTSSYWYLDPTFVNTSGNSIYVTYNASLGTVSNTSSKINQYIQPGQAFWVQNDGSGSAPTLTIQESDKVLPSTAAETSIFGTTSLNRIALNLLKNGGSVDGAVVVFRSDLTNELGSWNSHKFSNAGENISILNSGKNLSIEGTSLPKVGDVLQLHLYNLQASTKYQLQLDASIFNGNGVAAYVNDAFLNQRTMLDSTITTINFTTTSDTASYNSRFSIGFIANTLPIKSIVATASISNKIATVKWNTAGEIGQAYFEVEKSDDGKTFTSIGKETAKNTLTASYTATDNNITTSVSYYRIKAVGSAGSINYSNVVKLNTETVGSFVKVYPNPVRGNVFALQLSGLQSGKYKVDLYDALGIKVYSNEFYNGTAEVLSINMGKHLAAGNYTVRVTGEGQSHQTIMIVAE